MHNHQKTDSARQRPGKAVVAETKTNPVYSAPAQFHEVQNRHIQKDVEEARPGKMEKLLDRVTATQVYSGPQIVPTYRIDQLLEEHDRQIQESTQRLRYEKRRASKISVNEKQIKDHYVPSVPVFVSRSNPDDLLEEHNRQIQESTQRLILETKKACKGKP